MSAGKVPLTTLPRTWAGTVGIAAQDLDATFSLPSSSIAAGQIQPAQQGLTVYNATGSSIVAGTLVYVQTPATLAAGNTGLLPQIALATNAGQATAATYLTTAAIANNGSGTVVKAATIGGLNTNAATAGDPVYLSTAGGFALTTAPVAPLHQIVGFVTVKSATVGQIFYNLLAQTTVVAAFLQAQFGSLAPSFGTANIALRVPFPGVIVGASLIPNGAWTQNGTNYFTLSAADGATALLSAATHVNTTDGNAAALNAGNNLVAVTNYALTIVPSISVAAGDVIAITATEHGTLASTFGGGTVTFAVNPT